MLCLQVWNVCKWHADFSADQALSREATARLDVDDDLGLDAEEVGNRYTPVSLSLSLYIYIYIYTYGICYIYTAQTQLGLGIIK